CRDREGARLEVEAPAVVGLEVQSSIVDRGADVLRAKGLEQRLPIDRQCVEIENEEIQVESMANVAPGHAARLESHTRQFAKRLVVALGQLFAPCLEALQLRELVNAERGLQVGEVVLEPERLRLARHDRL